MKLHVGLGVLGLVSVLSAREARADDTPPPPDMVERHPSKKAFGAGIALTATGASFLATGIAFEAVTVALVSNVSGGDGAGVGALAGLAMGSLLSGTLAVIGLSTLIPGIVLMVNNRPVKLQAENVLRDAHAAPPLPRFVSVPILTAHF